jgi:GTPase involved in cell partitioning and DNA repair
MEERIMIIDWTHEEAVKARDQEVCHTVLDILEDAHEITVKEAMAHIEDEFTRYQLELSALPCRLLGVLIVAEEADLITKEQMKELYAYVEAASGEYLEKRRAC